MLAVGFSQMSFIRGRKIPSISSFMRVFIMNGFEFCLVAEFLFMIMWFFSPFVLLMWLSSVAQSCLTLCNPMDCSTYTRPPCPLSTPGVYSNSCSLSWWCHPTILSSVPFSSCFNLSQHQGLCQWISSSSGGRSIGVSASASVRPMNIQDWSL